MPFRKCPVLTHTFRSGSTGPRYGHSSGVAGRAGAGHGVDALAAEPAGEFGEVLAYDQF